MIIQVEMNKRKYQQEYKIANTRKYKVPCHANKTILTGTVKPNERKHQHLPIADDTQTLSKLSTTSSKQITEGKSKSKEKSKWTKQSLTY